jgi:hypothetical protein
MRLSNGNQVIGDQHESMITDVDRLARGGKNSKRLERALSPKFENFFRCHMESFAATNCSLELYRPGLNG